MRFRLPKSSILRGYRSFSRVLADSTSVTHPPLRLFVHRSTDETAAPRIGFAVAKTFRSAARRNHVRRLMREAFRLESAGWSTDSRWRGRELVLMYTTSPSQRESFESIRNGVRELLRKAVKGPL